MCTFKNLSDLVRDMWIVVCGWLSGFGRLSLQLGFIRPFVLFISLYDFQEIGLCAQNTASILTQ
jgi:hypothetical protein